MKVNLFDIDINGNIKLTRHVKNIWQLNYIVEKFGEKNALKLFKIFDFTFNLNPKDNPFANLPEENKYETILMATYPELEVDIDLDDEIIEQALDLVGELYDTLSYRTFRLLKITTEKLQKKLEFVDISLTKDEGNTAEIKKALEILEDLKKKLSIAYKEYEDELEVIRLKGGRESTDRRNNGKQKELD